MAEPDRAGIGRWRSSGDRRIGSPTRPGGRHNLPHRRTGSPDAVVRRRGHRVRRDGRHHVLADRHSARPSAVHPPVLPIPPPGRRPAVGDDLGSALPIPGEIGVLDRLPGTMATLGPVAFGVLSPIELGLWMSVTAILLWTPTPSSVPPLPQTTPPSPARAAAAPLAVPPQATRPPPDTRSRPSPPTALADASPAGPSR